MKYLIAFSLSLALFLAACAPTLSPEETLAEPEIATQSTESVIIDALGREVHLAQPPQKIVITGKAVFMIADAAYLFPSAMDKIVGMGSAAQGQNNFIALIDPLYEQKATLEQNASAEQVAALQPDLVILKSYLADSVGAPIEILGIPVIYVDFETPKQYTRDLAIFGKVFQDEKRASELIEFYQAKVRQIEEAVQDAPKTRTLILSYNEKDGNVAFSVPPTDWIQTQMTQVAGGEPIWVNASLGDGWTQVSLEQIAVWDVDQIFVISYFAPAEDVVESLKVDANWQGLRAVQEENLYAFPSDMYSWGQPDTRWILGLIWQAEKMHPELFPNHDMTQETQTFYETLYGLDETFYTEHLLPLLRAD